MKVTLKDISEETGFSISTVSRVLRGEGGTSDENVKKIITKALEIGYPVPKRLKIKPGIQAGSLALVTEFRTGEFYSSFVRGFIDSTEDRDLRISLYSTKPDLEELLALLIHIKMLGYIGAILFLPELQEDDYKQIVKELPKDFAIISCSNIDHSIVDTVTFDSYQGASLVARHFLEKGYNKLGIIQGPGKFTEARFRYNGFVDYVNHIAEKSIVWKFNGDYTAESGAEAFESYSKAEVKPDAIFALNDEMAIGFLEASNKTKIKIPEDVALAGYDDLPMCKIHNPRLTSVTTDYARLAKKAIEQVLEYYKNPKKHEGIVSMIPVSLTIREST